MYRKSSSPGESRQSKARVRTTDSVQTFSVPEDAMCKEVIVKIESPGNQIRCQTYLSLEAVKNKFH